MDINFELYKMFYFAANAQSFSAAAGELFITQSAVSQGIKNLETKLGTPLFLRKKRSLQLTTEGELLFSHIKQAYNLIKAGELKLEEIKNLQAGEVRVGASDTVCKYFLLPQVKKFNEEFPQVKIQFFNRTSPQIREALKNGLIDLGIITVREGEAEFLVTDLYEAEDILVAGEKFAHLRNKSMELADLRSLPLLLLEKKSSTREAFDQFLAKKGIEITPKIELESVDLLVELAKIGFGVAHVLKESAVAAMNRGELFKVQTKTPLAKRRLGMITMKNVPLSRAAKKLIALLLPGKS